MYNANIKAPHKTKYNNNNIKANHKNLPKIKFALEGFLDKIKSIVFLLISL